MARAARGGKGGKIRGGKGGKRMPKGKAGGGGRET